MDKFDKKNIIIFILVAIVFILGSAYGLNLLRIQNINAKNTMTNYFFELLASFIFGILISIPNMIQELKKEGKLAFDLNKGVMFILPSLVLIIIESQLIYGSLFFHKATSYFTVILLSYGIFSSINKKI
jgi:hypothetical protein